MPIPLRYLLVRILRYVQYLWSVSDIIQCSTRWIGPCVYYKKRKSWNVLVLKQLLFLCTSLNFDLCIFCSSRIYLIYLSYNFEWVCSIWNRHTCTTNLPMTVLPFLPIMVTLLMQMSISKGTRMCFLHGLWAFFLTVWMLSSTQLRYPLPCLGY